MRRTPLLQLTCLNKNSIKISSVWSSDLPFGDLAMAVAASTLQAPLQADRSLSCQIAKT